LLPALLTALVELESTEQCVIQLECVEPTGLDELLEVGRRNGIREPQSQQGILANRYNAILRILMICAN